jgi:hypothetical protein
MEMALIECFECKQSISSAAPTCIHCGAPIAPGQASTSRASPLSFGQLPRDELVPEVSSMTARPAPKVEQVPEIALPVSRHRRRGAPMTAPETAPAADTGVRPVEVWLKIMVFLLPPFFVWFLLRRGHSLQQRLIGFGWLGLMILLSKH